jgi:hypothetical protein
MLDAILEPTWSYRYYSFDAQWSTNEMMGSMRNGQGDDLFVVFNLDGAFIKGFVHDAPIVAQKLPSEVYYRGLPREFEGCMTEPAFSPANVTFCLWRRNDQPSWSHSQGLSLGPDSDGSEYLLSLLDGDSENYRAWAASYYERDVSIEAVTAIYRHQPLTEDLISLLNPEQKVASLADDIAKIGYPALDYPQGRESHL